MSKSPAFQFYPADFLADENVAVMSLAGRGAYITLMCYCWREGSIPADLGRMGKLCGVDSSAMAELWQELWPCFEQLQGQPEGQPARYAHPRLERERLKQQEHGRERRESGRKGAISRWNKEKGIAQQPQLGDSSAIAKPIAEPMANNGFSSSSSCTSSSSTSNSSSLSLTSEVSSEILGETGERERAQPIALSSTAKQPEALLSSAIEAPSIAGDLSKIETSEEEAPFTATVSESDNSKLQAIEAIEQIIRTEYKFRVVDQSLDLDIKTQVGILYSAGVTPKDLIGFFEQRQKLPSLRFLARDFQQWQTNAVRIVQHKSSAIRHETKNTEGNAKVLDSWAEDMEKRYGGKDKSLPFDAKRVI